MTTKKTAEKSTTDETEQAENIEIVARKVGRFNFLIARFVDGYAAGWAFAVPQAFQEQLDIRLTARTVKKNQFRIWTQGQSFAFEIGDTFHNDRLAYDDWDSFLNGNNPVTLQIVGSSSAGYVTKSTIAVYGSPLLKYQVFAKDKQHQASAEWIRVIEQEFDPGSVEVRELRPDKARKEMIEKRKFTIPQDAFVALLQTGLLYDEEAAELVSYEFAPPHRF